MLNYDAKLPYVDTFLNMLMPFSFWHTRYAMETIRRFVDHPAMLAWYLHLRQALDSVQNDPRYPRRFVGKTQIPMDGLLPDWMGGGVFYKPLESLMPLEQVFLANAGQATRVFRTPTWRRRSGP